MNPRNKPFSFPSRSERASAGLAGPSERGYALLILMMLVTILLISLTVALPNIYTAGQREREEELIFRGNEYARAILLFHRQFNRYPVSVEELLKRTNGYRFLRHAYPDPMTRNGKWRFIHADANGSILDSKTQAHARPGAGTAAEAGGAPFSLGQPGETGQAPAPGGAAGTSQPLAAGPSEESGQAAAAGPPGQQPSALVPSNNQTQGAFIVGVASSSKKESIRIWNTHDHYGDWEFLGVPSNVSGTVTSQPPSSGTTNPQAPGGQNPQNPQPSQPPATNPGMNP